MSEGASQELVRSDVSHRLARVAWDCASWIGAGFLVIGTRYDFDLPPVFWSAALGYIAIACALQVLVGTILMLYRGRYRNASFEESIGLAAGVAVVAILVGISAICIYGLSAFPRAMAALVPPIALMLMAAGRWGYRARRTYVGRIELDGTVREPTLIYGAGDAGYKLVQLIGSNRSSPYRVVGFIDDAPSKRNLRLMGVPVLGDRDQIARIADDLGITTVILAIARASATMVREISDLVEGAGLQFRVLPPVEELFGRSMSLADIREVDIADILGRHQVQTDIAGIAGYVSGKRVLVTGAGGSIGSELARQVHRFGPSELILLDRDESLLHAVQLSIYGKGLLDTPDMVLADIRDEPTISQIFARHRPEVVFHAAALKHLPMLEQYPDEGWKTNVLGTLNVLRAARNNGCTRFVNISTDKAADPTSVLGYTKRMAERLTAWHARNGSAYLSVRFGNVLGSRGSMLHTFMQQIQAGGPVTVTDPEVTRYFMTVQEACELVIQAGAVGAPGEVLVLDMGEPVRILDVAHRLIENSGKHIEIVFTGLRHGEKLHEVLLSSSERDERRAHPKISHVRVPPLSPSELPPEALSRELDTLQPIWAPGWRQDLKLNG